MLRNLAIGLMAVAVLPAFPEAESWRIDSAHSAAHFAVRHMMVSTVRGHFGKLTGTVTYDPQAPEKSAVEASVEVAAIDTRESKRDAHLKSPDFFDAEQFPQMIFKSTRVEKVGEGRLKVTGELTLRGATRPVVFDVEGLTPAVKTPQGLRSGATGAAKISRKDFGMTWNRVIEAGGVTVGDEVSITVDLELIRR